MFDLNEYCIVLYQTTHSHNVENSGMLHQQTVDAPHDTNWTVRRQHR